MRPAFTRSAPSATTSSPSSERNLPACGRSPLGLDALLAKARKDTEDELDRKLADLRQRHDKLLAEADETQYYSVQREDKLHKQNVDLDAQEENLKARNEQLLRAIAEYNGRIRVMGSGFGFFVNFFGMRALQAEKRERIDQEQANLAARIDGLRSQWAARDTEHARQQKELREKWTDLSTRASGLQAAIDHLQQTRSSVVSRSSLERVLFERFLRWTPTRPKGRSRAPVPGRQRPDPVVLPRVRPAREARPNRSRREHRRDRRGQSPPPALLRGHAWLSGLIGLLVGVRSGLEAFARSVQSMIENEGKYPLPKLAIDVPKECLAFEQRFEALTAMVQTRANHPLELARQARNVVAALDQNNLQRYFERMGQGLSKQAKAQWG